MCTEFIKMRKDGFDGERRIIVANAVQITNEKKRGRRKESEEKR